MGSFLQHSCGFLQLGFSYSSSGHHAIVFIGYDKIVLIENIAEVWELGNIPEPTQYELSRASNPKLVALTYFGIRVNFQQIRCWLIKLLGDPRAKICYSVF